MTCLIQKYPTHSIKVCLLLLNVLHSNPLIISSLFPLVAMENISVYGFVPNQLTLFILFSIWWTNRMAWKLCQIQLKSDFFSYDGNSSPHWLYPFTKDISSSSGNYLPICLCLVKFSRIRLTHKKGISILTFQLRWHALLMLYLYLKHKFNTIECIGEMIKGREADAFASFAMLLIELCWTHIVYKSKE